MQIQDAKAQGMWLMVWPDVSEKQLSRHPYPGISASPKEWNITIYFFLLPLSAVILGKFLLLDAN